MKYNTEKEGGDSMGNEFIKIFNKLTNSIGIITTTLTSILDIEWILFAGYLVLNIVDYLTGTIKAKITKTESSNKGIIGIIKKFCYWILIGITFFISFLLTKLGQKIGVNLDFIMLFGWFTLTCLTINESRSIIENLIEMGIEVPSFVKSGLESYQRKIKHTIENHKK